MTFQVDAVLERIKAFIRNGATDFLIRQKGTLVLSFEECVQLNTEIAVLRAQFAKQKDL